MAYELPTFYDSMAQVIRSMDTGDQIPPMQVPLSATMGNILQILSDGLYVGSTLALPSVVYINNVTGVDAPGNGTMAMPYATIDYAVSQLTMASVNHQLSTSTVLALQAGQTFPIVNDINLYGGTLTFAFYGDMNYGAYSSPPVGTGAIPAIMTDLMRPVLVPAVSLTSTNLWHMSGVNLYGGNISLLGVELELPMAPSGPSISLYSDAADFVRSMNYATPGYLDLQGAIVNQQDPTAFWGVLGVHARSTSFSLIQYASQFQVAGMLIDLANMSTSPELMARPYFIKFYPDFIGSNQQQGVLYDTAITATSASGLLKVLWADTQSYTIESTKTNLMSFPIAYDLVYGLRNYFYGITYDSLMRPVNVIPSRTI
jgi:hypothetical protein